MPPSDFELEVIFEDCALLSESNDSSDSSDSRTASSTSDSSYFSDTSVSNYSSDDGVSDDFNDASDSGNVSNANDLRNSSGPSITNNPSITNDSGNTSDASDSGNEISPQEGTSEDVISKRAIFPISLFHIASNPANSDWIMWNREGNVIRYCNTLKLLEALKEYGHTARVESTIGSAISNYNFTRHTYGHREITGSNPSQDLQQARKLLLWRFCTDISPVLGKRYLATGLVYINNLPAHIMGTAEILSIAQKHSIVYGIWTNPTLLTTTGAKRQVSVRLITERIPSTIIGISKLSDPTEADIAKLKAQLMEIAHAIQTQLMSPCLPIVRDPGMFQRSARDTLGLGPETRRFDERTTDTPKYNRGLIDGYRQGFRRARLRKVKNDIFQVSRESDNELDYLTSYLVSSHNRNKIC
ncbi:hypothetical protein EV178_006232 [Coemansia sp. RSA 1646]|nr:hypothetical protein EV178_006232 [Coemansia sp. RSA 1646]